MQWVKFIDRKPETGLRIFIKNGQSHFSTLYHPHMALLADAEWLDESDGWIKWEQGDEVPDGDKLLWSSFYERNEFGYYEPGSVFDDFDPLHPFRNSKGEKLYDITHYMSFPLPPKN